MLLHVRSHTITSKSPILLNNQSWSPTYYDVCQAKKQQQKTINYVHSQEPYQMIFHY